MNNPHALGIGFMEDALRAAFGPNFWIRVQMTMDLSPLSVVDPDLAVIAGGIRSHVGSNNPTTALLVGEVADTSLYFDRNTKANLYAASGIADYWILNVRDAQLEVYRDPQPDASARFGHRYASRTILENGDIVSPLAAPSANIAVDDLLP
jgi:Uma2 family endonuclease